MLTSSLSNIHVIEPQETHGERRPRQGARNSPGYGGQTKVRRRARPTFCCFCLFGMLLIFNIILYLINKLLLLFVVVSLVLLLFR
jgi:hypothetical protein